MVCFSLRPLHGIVRFSPKWSRRVLHVGGITSTKKRENERKTKGERGKKIKIKRERDRKKRMRKSAR